MSFTAFFLVFSALSPLLAGSVLARISLVGPEAVAKDWLMPAAAIACLAAAVVAAVGDFSLLKLVALTASALATVALLLVSMVLVTFPSEFSEQTP